MWTPASEDMDSLLSACDFSLRDSWEDDEEQEGFSGMKSATRKATTTVQAPKRKGGPGMRVCCDQRGEKMFGHTVLSFIWTQKPSTSVIFFCVQSSSIICELIVWRAAVGWNTSQLTLGWRLIPLYVYRGQQFNLITNKIKV